MPGLFGWQVYLKKTSWQDISVLDRSTSLKLKKKLCRREAWLGFPSFCYVPSFFLFKSWAGPCDVTQWESVQTVLSTVYCQLCTQRPIAGGGSAVGATVSRTMIRSKTSSLARTAALIHARSVSSMASISDHLWCSEVTRARPGQCMATTQRLTQGQKRLFLMRSTSHGWRTS